MSELVGLRVFKMFPIRNIHSNNKAKYCNNKCKSKNNSNHNFFSKLKRYSNIVNIVRNKLKSNIAKAILSIVKSKLLYNHAVNGTKIADTIVSISFKIPISISILFSFILNSIFPTFKFVKQPFFIKTI